MSGSADFAALDDESNTELVHRAAAGDRDAWHVLVDRHVALIWSIARQFRLDESDAADVSQTTWLRLLENLGRLQDPERVASWLATTARRECLRTIARRKRVVVTDDVFVLDRQDSAQPEMDAHIISEERCREVRLALDCLPERWRRLLVLLSADPPMSYAEISRALDLPVGSIGPTRGRSLEKLRALLAE